MGNKGKRKTPLAISDILQEEFDIFLCVVHIRIRKNNIELMSYTIILREREYRWR